MLGLSIAIVMVLVGIIGIYQYFHIKSITGKLREYGIKTKAKIIKKVLHSHDTDNDGRTDTRWYTFKIEYTVDGKTYKRKFRSYLTDKFEEGDIIEIVYDSRKPKKIMYAEDFEKLGFDEGNKKAYKIMLYIAIFLIIAGIVFLGYIAIH